MRLQEQLDLAEKLWSQLVTSRDNMLQDSNLNSVFPDEYIYPYTVWDFVRPAFFCPHDVERVGILGDGGKNVCGMSRYEKASPGPSSETNTARPLIVYSFGVDDDSSFEAELLRRTNAEIWGYDFSVDSWGPQIASDYASRAHFAKVRLGNKTDTTHEPPSYTIQDLMRANGHTYVDILKIDVEGAEFDALDSLISSLETSDHEAYVPFPFGQLLMEVHIIPNGLDYTVPHDIYSWLNWWASLERHGLREVYAESNWLGDFILGRPRFKEASDTAHEILCS
ncbi:hypothetical protein FDECE_14828 [Fusarium decemcellulare]|nr:hypothetical protein FDECE_14828 [Fusarium decemcellulare]